ncbi:MAG: YdcF family protein [Oscillospiraceae bacterium]|nr:YdcF family protein [Oscillospiraceae bacterium]
MEQQLRMLADTRVLLGIFLVFLCAFFLFSLLRPYRLSNSFLLLFSLLTLVPAAVSAMVDGAEEILRVSVLAVSVMLFLVPILLIWNGVVILRRESLSLSSCLPLLMGLVIAAGEIASVLCLLRDSFDFLSVLHRPVLLLIGATVFYAAALLLAFVLYMLLLPVLPRKRVFDTVIVHGCALIRGDQISRILARRLDLALKLYRRSGEKALLVVSGGKGSDETVSEASAMRGYLLERGVPGERILMEDQSHSTRENLRFTDQLLLERGGGGRIALVTSGYHIFRCVWIAHELSFPCTGFGAPVAAYYWPSAVIREFIAVYSRKRYLTVSLAGYLLLVVGPILYWLFYMT